MNTEERLKKLEAFVANFMTSDRYTIHKTIQFFEGRDIQLGTANGTRIGTSALQKLGFFGATPVVQQSAISVPTGGGSADGDAVDITARVAISQIRTALQNTGITA